MSNVIELRNVTKEYRSVPAVKNISLTLRRGEVHALLGENGAGKSTLTKMMAGVVTPTSGEILLDGQPVSFASPHEALAAGIAMVFQETSLVPSLTVAQNIYLGHEKLFNRLRGLYISAQTFLQSLNFPVDPTMNVSQLGAAQKQMVEIARAVHHKARVLIFDELANVHRRIDGEVQALQEGLRRDVEPSQSIEQLFVAKVDVLCNRQ